MWRISELLELGPQALRLERPELAWLALGSCALLALLLLLRGPARVRVSARARAARFARPDLAWLGSVALRIGALAALLVTAARPVGLVPENAAAGSGVDLVIALDASGSMLALDADLDGRQVTRLALAKRVVSEFIAARSGDRVGLVVFGEHAFTQTPLTVDHRLVQAALARVESGLVGDATALGEAIGLATRRLSIDGEPEHGRRVLVLVTDGRHNSGKLAPKTAAELARGAGVRVHAVGIGSTGLAPFAADAPGGPLRFERVDLDRATLADVAETTGGRFFHARRPDDLSAVATSIDRLEARPASGPPRFRHASLAPFTLALAAALLIFEALGAHGFARRLP